MGASKKQPAKAAENQLVHLGAAAVAEEQPTEVGADKKGKKRKQRAETEAKVEQTLEVADATNEPSAKAKRKKGKETQAAEQASAAQAQAVDATNEPKVKRKKGKELVVEAEAAEQVAEALAQDAGATNEPAAVAKRKKEPVVEEAAAAAPDAATPAANELDAAAFRAKMQIASPTAGAELPDPAQSFAAAPFGRKIKAALQSAGFAAPTAIQAQGWPLAVRGDDMVSVAKTGSGKTLAFLLPAFRRIAKERLDPSSGPCLLVLAPTRELATQIAEVAEQFGSCADVRTAVLFGGVPKPPQVKALKSKPHLVVATPGRLMDLCNDKSVTLGDVTFLVLDEADRMLDMGFEPQMEKIMAQVPSERQTLLFSATWPKSVQKLASKYLKKDFVHINVGETEDLAANKAVTQEFFKLDDDEKENKLWRILYDMGENTKIIIFANTKNRINNLQKAVWNAGYDCVAMHGDKTQWERDAGLAKFVSGETPIMVATDVCARGLDIKDVSHVLNFDMARDVESYIHRIGRTGRGGNSGTSITFFNEAYDTECAPALAKIAREAGQPVPAFLEKAAEKGAKSKNKQWKY